MLEAGAEKLTEVDLNEGSGETPLPANTQALGNNALARASTPAALFFYPGA